MNSLREEIEGRIRERYGSVPRLAKLLGMPDQTIYSSLKGNLIGSSMSTVFPIIAALDLDPLLLLQGKVRTILPEGKGYVLTPLVRHYHADQQSDSLPDTPSFPVPSAVCDAHPESFLLSVNDNAMDKVLPKGSYALVLPTPSIDVPDEPYAVCIGPNEATVRRGKLLENGFRLTAESSDPTYRDIVVDYADPRSPDARIIGRVIWYTLPFEWKFTQD